MRISVKSKSKSKSKPKPKSKSRTCTFVLSAGIVLALLSAGCSRRDGASTGPAEREGASPGGPAPAVAERPAVTPEAPPVKPVPPPAAPPAAPPEEPAPPPPPPAPEPAPKIGAADWPQYLGPDRDMRSKETGLARTWPEGGPEVLWTVKLGAGFAGPCVSNGEVFVLDRVGGSKDTKDVLRCFGFENGEELWTFEYDAPGKFSHNGSRSTPAADAERVFTVGPLGHFHCVSRETHQPIWKKQLLGDFGGRRPNWAVTQSPLLYKHTVIVAPQKSAGIVAFARATGEVVWKTPALEGMSYCSPMPMTIGGLDQVVMLSNKGTVSGVDASTGAPLWTYAGWECRIPITSPVHVGEGRIFISGGYDAGSAMIRVEKNGGGFEVTELYKSDQVGSQMHLPLVHEGHMYISNNDNDRRDGLTCMDLDGNIKWKTQSSPNFERGNLLLADGMIYIMDGKSAAIHLVEASPEGYKELAKAKLHKGSGKEFWAPMALVGGKLIARDQREMKCLDVRAR